MSTRLTINSHNFNLTPRYSEGHICTAAEADVLNARLAANIRTNFSRIMDSMIATEETMPEIRKAFTAYANSYSFGGPTPIDLEARVIAEAIIRQRLKAAKKNISDYTRTAIADQAAALLAPSSPLRADIYAQATSRVQAIQQAAAKDPIETETPISNIPRRKATLDIEGLE